MQNLKLKIFFLAIIFGWVFGVAEKSFGATINAVSCSYNDVSSAITAASPEDTVVVPQGSCIWNSGLNITKGINLIGGLGGVTTITAATSFGDDFMIKYSPTTNNLQYNYAFRLSGFTIDADNKAHGVVLGGQIDPPYVMQDKVRVDHNIIQNTLGYKGIWNFCNFYGVVDNNIITNADYPIKNDTQSSEVSWYSNAPQNIFISGTNNYLYFEDNTITYEGHPDGLALESQFNGRYAARYNTIIAHGPSYSLFEAHGHQGEGSSGETMGSTFGAEVYGNRVEAADYHMIFFKTRGGRSFIFYNSVATTYVLSNEAYDGLLTCPAIYAYEQMIHDTYWWQTRKDFTGSLAETAADHPLGVTCAGLANRPTLGRDVFSDSSSPGVGCGILENRPLTCIVGQGYWATNQSCADLTGMVGTNPATPISGTLYKCTQENTWTAFYTPYVYPHPLRNESSDTTPPSSPIGLMVE
ncbi:MAG: hypothetical protein WC848_06660 [Parcubacteria group bacterium]|jgi:hypothetical protein